MKLSMLNRKSLLLLAVVLSLVVATVLSVSHWDGSAKAQAGFSAASLRGTYAFITVGGSDIEATLGILVADGMGNITNANLRLNVPASVVQPGAPAGTRAVVPAIGTGTYTVRADGTGTAAATVDTAAGRLTRNFESVVAAVNSNGIATEVFLTQREATLGGGLGYFALKRVGD